jgi:hypothetical protein
MAVMKEMQSSCFLVTLSAVAERRHADLLDATVTATGHMSRRDDGRLGFTVTKVTVTEAASPAA